MSHTSEHQRLLAIHRDLLSNGGHVTEKMLADERARVFGALAEACKSATSSSTKPEAPASPPAAEPTTETDDMPPLMDIPRARTDALQLFMQFGQTHHLAEPMHVICDLFDRCNADANRAILMVTSTRRGREEPDYALAHNLLSLHAALSRPEATTLQRCVAAVLEKGAMGKNYTPESLTALRALYELMSV